MSNSPLSILDFFSYNCDIKLFSFLNKKKVVDQHKIIFYGDCFKFNKNQMKNKAVIKEKSKNLFSSRENSKQTNFKIQYFLNY